MAEVTTEAGIRRVARNHFVKARIRERRRLRRLWEVIGQLSSARDCQLPDDDSEDLVLALVGRLPREQRAVMAFTYDGWSPAEIAELLEKDPQTVRSTLRQARIAVRRAASSRSRRAGCGLPRPGRCSGASYDSCLPTLASARTASPED
ncbi:RNA polymerase sigma factor [Paractinoplanes rishiriensis]|uniref:RNA polymerase sigma factor n=1 Tax=Paractinoplanes rishiriensis TaxID=1050105 RepID=UPI001941B731|nr:sigma-70 region 4 domain-containing protein [Actinoplanes rishiriensis]